MVYLSDTRVGSMCKQAVLGGGVVMKRQAAKTTVVKKASVKKAVIKKIATRATKASAKLENRQVPAGHVRSAGVQRLLAERQARRR
jgi:ribosomal protein S17